MRISRLFLMGVMCFCTALSAQEVKDRGFIREGVIRHYGTHATLEANSDKPLLQAIIAFRAEYGLRINYEEPPYWSKFDVLDISDAYARVLIIAGGPFKSDYAESVNFRNSPQEQANALSKIVSDYNQSSNPGQFAVRQELDGSFTVVGISVKDANGNAQSVSSFLDTPVSIPSDSRFAFVAIREVLAAVSAKTGIKADSIGVSPHYLNAKVTIGGNNIPARKLLSEICASSSLKLHWDLIYDPTAPEYLLSIEPVVRAQYDTFGRKTIVR
jgi:hypothetical protein